MKKLLTVTLAFVMLMTMSAALADELTLIKGYNIGADTGGPITGWVGDLWATKGLQLEAINTANSPEQVSLMLSSGDLPSIVRFANWVDFEMAIEAGYLLDLGQYLDKLPNTVKYAEDALQYMRDYHSCDTGNLYGIPMVIGNNRFTTDAGCYAFNMRWDIYAQAGYPKAEKLEDMIDVFLKMKEVYPKNPDGLETYPLNTFAEWDGGKRFSFANAVLCTLGYNELGQYYFVDHHIPTDKVNSIFQDDSAFKRACKFLFSMNQAGLIDPDSMTQQYTTSQSKIASGQYFGCWWGGYKSAFDTLEKKNSDPPVGIMPVMFDEYIASTMGNYPIGTSWPLCVSAKVAEDPALLEACLKFVDANADPAFLYELYNGPKGIFWDYKEDGTTYATDAYYEYATTGKYVLPSGQEYAYWNGRYTLRDNYMVDNGLIDGTFAKEARTFTNKSKLTDAWSEFYGGEYEFPIDKLWAENRIALRPLAVVSFIPSLSEDMQITRDAIGAIVQQAGWKMVYAKDEAEFEEIWAAMRADAEALGVADIQTWFREQLEDAKAAAAKYE